MKRRPLGAFWSAIGRCLFRLLFRAKVEGLERAASCPPGTVVIANHLSYLDAAALAVFLPFKVTFAISPSVARLWWVRVWLGVFEAVPVSRNRAHSLRPLVRAIRSGNFVVIFPEGRISSTGGLMKTYPGAAVLAQVGSGKVLPVGIVGPETSVFGRAVSCGGSRFPRITLWIGEPESIVERNEAAAARLYDLLHSAMVAAGQEHASREDPVQRRGGRVVPIGASTSFAETLDGVAPEWSVELAEAALGFLAAFPMPPGRRILVAGLGADDPRRRLLATVATLAGAVLLDAVEPSAVVRIRELVYELRVEDLFATPGVLEASGMFPGVGEGLTLRRCFRLSSPEEAAGSPGNPDAPVFTISLATDDPGRLLLPDPWIAGRWIGERPSAPE